MQRVHSNMDTYVYPTDTLRNLRYPTNTQQVVLLFIFSFTDPRKCKLHIDRIHVATNDEIVSKMDDSFWGVPFFMCDLWGMKATLKSNRALL